MNKVQIFDGLKVKEESGRVMFDAETVAIGIGIVESDGKYVRWQRVNKYLGKNSPQVEKIKKGDFITEQQLYKLAIKAESKQAERFQDWVTSEVLPSIRKTGGYQMKPMSTIELLETEFQAIKEVTEDQKALRGEMTELKESFGLPNDYRKRWTKARNKRVMEIMGGYYGTAYGNKKLRSAVFRELARYLKDRFDIDEYPTLPLSKFDEAIRRTENWKPSEVTELAIDGANAQSLLEA